MLKFPNGESGIFINDEMVKRWIEICALEWILSLDWILPPGTLSRGKFPRTVLWENPSPSTKIDKLLGCNLSREISWDRVVLIYLRWYRFYWLVLESMHTLWYVSLHASSLRPGRLSGMSRGILVQWGTRQDVFAHDLAFRWLHRQGNTFLIKDSSPPIEKKGLAWNCAKRTRVSDHS